MESRDTLTTLRNHIDDLALQYASLDPTKEEWTEWVQEAMNYTIKFLDTTRNGPAWRPYSDNIRTYEAAFEFSDSPGDLRSILQTTQRWIDQDGLNPASGGHLGYIPGGGVLPAAIGDFIAAVTNRYAGIAFANPGAVALENFLIRWMADLFSFPKSSGGTLTSGGSIANLVAITTARDAAGLRPSQYEKAVIYGSSQMHHCLHKALRIAGLGYSILREIPLDDQHRINAQDLERTIEEDRQLGLQPFLIIGSAGTTDTGTIDPLEQLADIAQKENVWFHIDAAYGGFFYLLEDQKRSLKGMELADSLVIDPHKGLFLPYGTGAVLIRDIELLAKSHYYKASYMQDAEVEGLGYSPADLSPELTRHFRGLRMFFALKMNGLNAYKACLKEKLLLCKYFHECIQLMGFQTGPTPLLSVTYFRYNPKGVDPDIVTEWLIKAIHADGRQFLSSTTLDGHIWIRLAVLSFRTKMQHIDSVLMMIRALKTKMDIQFEIAHD
jgi:aromatic-L-amino-acid decarboxylase